jgi:hypothetical protein
MRLVAVIEDEHIARRILAHMGLSTRAPPRGAVMNPIERCLSLGGLQCDQCGSWMLRL